MVMKFCGWIDLTKAECNAHDPNSCLLNFLVIALCLFCPVHISKTILAMAMKFRGWLQLGVRRAYFATVCGFCSQYMFSKAFF